MRGKNKVGRTKSRKEKGEIMKRARIKPRVVKSQYSREASLLDGYNLVVEGGATTHFKTREAAAQYAASKGYKLVYSGR